MEGDSTALARSERVVERIDVAARGASFVVRTALLTWSAWSLRGWTIHWDWSEAPSAMGAGGASEAAAWLLSRVEAFARAHATGSRTAAAAWIVTTIRQWFAFAGACLLVQLVDYSDLIHGDRAAKAILAGVMVWQLLGAGLRSVFGPRA